VGSTGRILPVTVGPPPNLRRHAGEVAANITRGARAVTAERLGRMTAQHADDGATQPMMAQHGRMTAEQLAC
jgi:hypothetical protein